MLKKRFDIYLKRTKSLENGPTVPGLFINLPAYNNQPSKNCKTRSFVWRIFELTWVLYLRDWDKDHCLFNEALRAKLKEDEPLLIKMYIYSNSAIPETE